MPGTLVQDELLALPGGLVAEMGCGEAELLIWLARARGGVLGAGIDLDAVAVAAGRRAVERAGLAGRVRLLVEDCRRTSLAAGCAVAVVMRALLHHLDPIEEPLREAHRVLRAGGLLLLWDGTRLPDAEFAEMNGHLAAAGLPLEAQPGFDVAALGATLAGLGYVVERVREDGTVTFATPPYTPRVFSTPAFLLLARKPTVATDAPGDG